MGKNTTYSYTYLSWLYELDVALIVMLLLLYTILLSTVLTLPSSELAKINSDL